MPYKLVRELKPTGELIESHKLICTLVEGNHNKFWNTSLYDTGDVHREWGRLRTDSNGNLVVHDSATGTQQCGSVDVGRVEMTKEMNKKIRGKNVTNKDGDKVRESYTEVNTVDTAGAADASNVRGGQLKTAAAEDIGGCAEVQKLVEFLVEANVHQIEQFTALRRNSSGLFATPLGVVDLASIQKARTALDNISKFVGKKDWESTESKIAVGEYLTLIPHDVGHKLRPRILFPDLKKLEAENDILDALEASYQAVMTAPVDDDGDKVERKRLFEVKLALAPTADYKRVKRLYEKTSNRMHAASRLGVKKVWTVEIPTARKKFNAKQAKLMGEVWELWHGTKASNLLSILKGGLVVPPSHSGHVTGRLFGNGIYASDQSTKALNYAMGAAPGQSRYRVNRWFMFLCNMAMGEIGMAKRTFGRYPMKGCDSTFAKGGTGFLRNNEMIAHSTDQVDLTYLVEFEG